MPAPFQLHPRLRQDCIDIGRLDLCRILMMDDSRYPWFILVPERADVTEIYQLEQPDRRALTDESCLLAETLAQVYRPDKLNIAAIGNLVPQLHIHHIARYTTDCAWPAPVWGKFDRIPYSPPQIESHTGRIKACLALS